MTPSCAPCSRCSIVVVLSLEFIMRNFVISSSKPPHTDVFCDVSKTYSCWLTDVPIRHPSKQEGLSLRVMLPSAVTTSRVNLACGVVTQEAAHTKTKSISLLLLETTYQVWDPTVVAALPSPRHLSCCVQAETRGRTEDGLCGVTT